jgi:RNA polymerase sigma-B factor
MTVTPIRSAASTARRAGSRAERSRLTHELLLEAHETVDRVERDRLLDEVILLNRGVAEAVAARYRNRGLAADDLEQTAFEGLIKAVRKFDPSVRPDLLTYAVPTIRGEIQRHFRDHGWTVRPPRRIQEMQWRINRGAETLAQELGREPSEDELCHHVGCTPAQLREAVAAFGTFTPASLDRPLAGQETLTVGDTLAVTDETEIDQVDAVALLQEALPHLCERDRQIVRMRFFEDRTQAEIGAHLGITQMQVSRLQSRILRDLRRHLEG